ncbi:hypothetical protein AcV5_002553 [Taiwanofungus camphoratus]|nr:hypothetical protein AcV5_002553 [Antrodia cinnamomea]KAI0918608.1 hypothetical protein AcV5_002553 [Antrodia cinnamomea]KAI0942143.1 hypothetical protein AcV7_002660 [Antrodia cinnamomea]
MSNESAVRQLILALQEIFVENYYTSATATLFFYDYLITIGQEIEVVWRRKLTGATLLYVLNRYLIFIFFPFYLVVMFDESLPCEVRISFSSMVYIGLTFVI